MNTEVRRKAVLAGLAASGLLAGLAGGFAYWAVAGWNAGFWKPVFRSGAPPAPPPDANPSVGQNLL